MGFIAWEESSTEPSDEPSESTIDACTIAAIGICSETPAGAVPEADCTAAGGVVSNVPCGIDGFLKCEDNDVPGYEGVKSTAYIQSEATYQAILATQAAAGLNTECEAVPVMVDQLLQGL